MLNVLDLNNQSIVLSHVGKTYPSNKEVALQDVSFTVNNGEFVCIVGPSGCGKSTILKLITGIEQATSGTIQKPDAISMVFQSGALFPWLSVYDNVAFGLRAKNTPPAIVAKKVRMYLEMMSLENFATKLPSELSGGQRQRVGIARALAVNPKVLLLDEPFSALDPKTTAELHEDLLKIWRETKTTIVMVSHLIEEAVALADRVIVMRKGSIAEIFPVKLAYPRREQGADFMHDVQAIRKEFFK